jgi:NADH:ubiquinone oxidoreductase subunit K
MLSQQGLVFVLFLLIVTAVNETLVVVAVLVIDWRRTVTGTIFPSWTHHWVPIL